MTSPTDTSLGETLSRAERKKQELRREIIDAAFDCFAEQGYHATGIADIATRLGIGHGTFYRYFENKRDLVVKVIEDWYESMLADYDQHLDGIAGTRNRLRYMIWRHLKTIHDEPALCNLMFQFLRTGKDYSHTAVHELNRRYTRRTLDIVREGVDAGELRDDVSLALVRDMIYGCVEHRTWSYLRGEGEFDPDATADAIVELILSGLRKRGPEPAPGGADLADRIEKAVERLESLAGNKAS